MTAARREGGRRLGGAARQSLPGKPLVSVVTVVYNGARHLEQAILSVLNQGYDNIEYLVVDGGSSDGTMAIVERYGDRIDYFVSEPDRGIYDAMNKGIALACGDLVALLNADDYYEPGAVEAVVEQFLADPAAEILYGHKYVVQEGLSLRYPSRASLDYWRGMCFSHQAMFVARDAYSRFGPYDTTLRIAADYDFVVRTATGGARFRAVDAFLVNYRDSGLSAQNQIASMLEGRRVLRRYVSFFSYRHFVSLTLLAKSLILAAMIRLIGMVCGEKAVAAASAWYLKTFFARDKASPREPGPRTQA